MKITNSLHAFLRYSAALVLGATPIIGMVAVAKSLDGKIDKVSEPSGTLTYQGVVSGGVTFPSSDCSFDESHHMVGFVAPHQDGRHPEIRTPGPIIAVAFFDPGAAINFSTDHINSTNQNVFLLLKKKDGVSYAKKGDKWMVTITNLKMPNTDVMNQQWTTLSGTFVCTHLVNG